jgi:hypothetical protein
MKKMKKKVGGCPSFFILKAYKFRNSLITANVYSKVWRRITDNAYFAGRQP